jgi:Baseplate J-like protein
VMAAFTEIQAQNARLGFADLSSGQWLGLKAQYDYGIDPELLDATFATGTVTLRNNGGGVYDVDAFDLIVTNPTNGASFRNSAAFHLGALGQVDVPIIAIEIGAASSSDAAAITQLTTPLNQVTCTNAARVDGRDALKDPEVRTLCGESLGALSPFGPWDAYSYACRTATRADGSTLGITRTRLNKDGYGNVTVYVATDSGAVVSGDVDVAQDAVAQRAEPQGVNATVHSAVARIVPVAYEAWLYNTSGQLPADIESAIRAQITAFFATQPISGNVLPPDTTGKVFTSGIGAAIGAAFPEVIRVVVAGDDTSLAANEVPVLGVVTATIHQVPTPEGHSV